MNSQDKELTKVFAKLQKLRKEKQKAIIENDYSKAFTLYKKIKALNRVNISLRYSPQFEAFKYGLINREKVLSSVKASASHYKLNHELETCFRKLI